MSLRIQKSFSKNRKLVSFLILASRNFPIFKRLNSRKETQLDDGDDDDDDDDDDNDDVDYQGDDVDNDD